MEAPRFTLALLRPNYHSCIVFCTVYPCHILALLCWSRTLQSTLVHHCIGWRTSNSFYSFNTPFWRCSASMGTVQSLLALWSLALVLFFFCPCFPNIFYIVFISILHSPSGAPLLHTVFPIWHSSIPGSCFRYSS
jgi:hypothetical protein